LWRPDPLVTPLWPIDLSGRCMKVKVTINPIYPLKRMKANLLMLTSVSSGFHKHFKKYQYLVTFSRIVFKLLHNLSFFLIVYIKFHIQRSYLIDFRTLLQYTQIQKIIKLKNDKNVFYCLHIAKEINETNIKTNTKYDHFDHQV
jgi:hypothetical protein